MSDAGVLRTARAERIAFGVAQVRRELSSGKLRVLHLVFAPFRPRPVLFGIVRLHNTGSTPLGLEYTEVWEISGARTRSDVGACVLETPDGERVLADVSAAVRAAPLQPPPKAGLCLVQRAVLPPRSIRELAFAYAAPPPEDSAAALVRAWRGDVAGELARTVAAWRARMRGTDVLTGYCRWAADNA